MTELHTGARAPAGAGGDARDLARQAGGQVAGTAREQAGHVASELSSHARSAASDIRGRVTEQARSQSDRLAEGIRRMADELRDMASGHQESPVGGLVSTVADSGQKLADHLTQRGPEGVLSEVQDFARRRPGAFLTAALVGGFVVGRLGRNLLGSGDGHREGTGFGDTLPESASPVPAVTPVPPVPPPPPTGGVYPESPIPRAYPEPTPAYPDPSPERRGGPGR